MANQPNKVRVGVDHKGRNRAIAQAGDVPLAVHHGPAIARGMEHQPTQVHIARGGKPKAHLAVPVHNGMASRTRNGGPFVLGGDMASKFDANPASPLQGAPRGKSLTQPQPVPGQRSRATDTPHSGAPGENHARGKPNAAAMADLGRAILGEALAHSAPDDRQAHGYGIGTLPDSTAE